MSNDLGRLNILSYDNQFRDPSLDRFRRFVCARSQLASVFGDLQYLVGFVNRFFRNLESYINRFLSHLASSHQLEKPKAKKHRMRGDLYDLSGAVAKLKNRKCPRCGSVMAFHGGSAQRWVCGSCSFTDYGQK